MKKIKHLLKVWKKIASLSLQDQTATLWGMIVFVLGKIVKFALFFVFLFSVMSEADSLAGYTREQVVVFFLVFNIVDISSQAIFRGVYNFRQVIINGNFDYDLIKPLPSFFRPLFGWADVADIFTLIPLWGGFLYFIFKNGIVENPIYYLIFALTIVVSFIIGFSFHLFVSGIGVISTEVDHLIWVYRDLIGMGRFPTDIYPKMIQMGLTFFIPVIVLVTIPAKGLMGMLSLQTVLVCIGVTVLFLVFSLWFWKRSLGQYTSASS